MGGGKKAIPDCQQAERWQEAQTHIVCDFLSKVGLCDENLGDFLTGSVKHTGHQWVFVIPQPGFLWEVAAWESKWHQTWDMKVQILSWHSHSDSYDSPPDSCTMYKTNSSDLFSTFTDTNADNFLIWMCSGRLLFPLATWITTYPELVKQQVEDLSGRHGAVDSHVGDRTIGRGKYRRLKKKKREMMAVNFLTLNGVLSFQQSKMRHKEKTNNKWVQDSQLPLLREKHSMKMLQNFQINLHFICW